VGSSNSILRLHRQRRAIATRCCWPPLVFGWRPRALQAPEAQVFARAPRPRRAAGPAHAPALR
jgi:hypothetical protein